MPVLVGEIRMAVTTFKERLAVLKESLLAVPSEKLVEILLERAVYDQSLWTYLDAMTKVAAPANGGVELSSLAKRIIERAYGETLDPRDASYHEPELYAAQSIVEQIFEKGQYQQVIDLFEWSLQFEENLSEPCEPDDLLNTAYMPLAVLCLRSHLRLGKAPAEVAAIFTKLHDADEYGLFSDLSYLGANDEAELAQVKKILEKPRK
ncbi:MAG: hypothetical protein QG574_4943 [Cyanobacteriota bacterium erpe_2018_sw_21hr_WHONDRS-SW48-000092_B_bin.40]|nr:hypothetical protein [Cyanobacteriota bacterium erpe_2018_sw_21hr_WHONDRS-SW48-000092_B_bin.40]